MPYQLLVDLSVLEWMSTLSPQQRRKLMRFFQQIKQYPTNSSLASKKGEGGEILQLANLDRLEIYYWIDAADQKIHVLRIEVVI